MIFFLGFISGILFLAVVYYINKLIFKRRKNKPIELRKGIVELGFNYTDNKSGQRKYCTTEVEILEISRTDKKSKIQVLDTHSLIPEWNAPSRKKELTDLYNNSWINTKDIKWIEFIGIDPNDLSAIRDKKLNEILNDNK
jgi:hypothetical protein